MTLKSTVADRDIFINPAIINFSRSFNDPVLINNALEKAHADACFNNAVKEADKGNLSEAFDNFIEGLKLRNITDNAVAMRYARKKLSIVNTLNERIKELEAKISADEARFLDMAQEYTSLGDDCRQDDMPIPAIANYDKALTLIPTHIPALYGRALAYQSMDEHKKALEDFTIVAGNDPTDIEVLIRMATSYHILDDIHNAMDRCLLALDLTEDNDYPRPLLRSLHTLLAELYEQIGDSAAADHHRSIAKRLSRYSQYCINKKEETDH